jgi:hypothetical protein
MISQIARRRLQFTYDLTHLKLHRQEAWWSASVLAGFVATFAMTVVLVAAYALAASLGQADGTLLLRWVWALAYTAPAQATASAWIWALALHLSLGLIWAVLYGGLGEPILRQAGQLGWRSGVLFALGPWGLSVTLFLPLTGAGFLGTAMDAGPRPLLGNLILHLVYGAVLGSFYALTRDVDLSDGGIHASAALDAERGAATGILGGLVTGAVLGWVLSPNLALAAGPVPVVVASAFTGAAMGALLGSFAGLDQSAAGRRIPDDGSASWPARKHHGEH